MISKDVPFIFDIDGTITDTTAKDYDKAIPDYAMITLLNMLYDRGHRIMIVTARGTGSKIDYREMTEKQLKDWGVKYHELIFGRIITDFARTPEDFLNEVE